MRKQVDQVNQNPAQGPEDAAEDAIEAMHAIMHLFRAHRLRMRDGPNGLAHMELKALGFFARHPGATQSDLVAHSERDKAQVARQIRALRERGLLVVREDASDRRSAHLSLSEQGRAVHAALRVNDGDLKAQALAGFTDDEKANLLALLARVRSNLQE